jgi:hypothetical protein
MGKGSDLGGRGKEREREWETVNSPCKGLGLGHGGIFKLDEGRERTMSVVVDEVGKKTRKGKSMPTKLDFEKGQVGDNEVRFGMNEMAEVEVDAALLVSRKYSLSLSFLYGRSQDD